MKQILRFCAGTTQHELTAFIREHADKRVTKRSYKFYKEPTSDGIAVVQRDEEWNIIGFSGAQILAGDVDCAVTVVRKEFRCMGFGSALLAAKIALLGDTYRAIVAWDNVASRRICVKAGLTMTGQQMRERGDGYYRAELWEKVEPPIAVLQFTGPAACFVR